MRRLLLVTALALCASVAHADNGLFYFGTGITISQVHGVGEPYSDNYVAGFDGVSFKVFAGIRPIKLFAVEVEYLDLGSQGHEPSEFDCFGPSACSVSENSGGRAFAGYALGFLPITVPHLDVYGKAGLARYELYDSMTFTDGSWEPKGSFKSTVFTWGAGVQMHFGTIGGRMEYEGLGMGGTSVISLSVFLNL
jgi:opacity protein-like surface antigen